MDNPLTLRARSVARDALLRGVVAASEILPPAIETARQIAHTGPDAAEALGVLDRAFDKGEMPK